MTMKSVLVILAVLMSLQQASGQTININVNVPEGGEKSSAVQTLLMTNLQERNLNLEFENAELKTKNANLEQRVSHLSNALCACNNKTHSCPSGYVQFCDKCYSFSSILDQKNYKDSRSACQAAGGHLAMPKDKATNDFLVKQIPSLYNYVALVHLGRVSWISVWFGLTDEVKEGIWVWEDGTTLGTTGWSDWYKGRPGVYVSDYDCAAWSINYHIKWAEFLCSEKFYYVCEKGATVIP
ncbi:PREDICTED: galactose-specific lectin nattectin-like [Branchiostoma belcheri]|uniref:Galactose-specific lectin nattectin-like n=1 Tax=Branchiostoma belcheri TaxID=7741 RepID=A0A6P4ZEJ7_BRABE|nr:PREDICTED: galactose-specific lectin nattectin-like [Branchiostoma belcheri]